ncbi:DNA-processing protein DprA [Marinilactibacillus kalidii]|uniref:DNA-processing protein DprA n=1 Tax=Marinilactibacillus kalidii TaxID=2820274 RepID=UPI001ABE4042|nr:DNA-processing protein DprA [Marinilactibacillus kalidii]
MMTKIATFESVSFVLAHYPSLTIEEKWCLLKERFAGHALFTDTFREYKKLSEKKKASFFRFESTFNEAVQLQCLSEKKISILPITHPHYPQRLKEIYFPPILLFYKGNSQLLSKKIIGIVGARDCTRYGIQCIEQLLPALVRNEIVICSGLARGIDTVAHCETLKASGKTIAVIGTGINRYYPAENQQLQKYIEESNLVLSEFPPDTRPLKHHFPLRNRIIAGLSDGVTVIEAKSRSGSLITAYQALEQNREVYAVPGPIFGELSEGTNALIKSGAKIVTSASDITEDFYDQMR